MVEFELANNVVTLIQHQLNVINKWLDKDKKIFNDNDIQPNYSYDLKVKDKQSGTTCIFKVSLDKVETDGEDKNGKPVKIEADYLGGTTFGITDISNQEVDPFDLPF